MTDAVVARPGAMREGSTQPRHRGDRGRYYAYMIPGAIGFVLVVLVPAVWNIVLSFTSWSGVGTPTFIGWENYAQLLHDDVFWKSFSNSIAVIIAMAIIPTFVGLFVAAVLFDYIAPMFGSKVASCLRALIYFPQIIPIAVVGVLWGFMLRPTDGAINTLLDSIGLGFLAQNWLGDPTLALPSVMVILIWIQMGYTVVMFVAGMARMDMSLHEAASVDGASWLQRFRVITVNQVRPEIAVVLLTTTVTALKVFAPIFVLTRGGPGDETIVPAYFAYYQFFTTTRVGYGAAIATVLAILLTLIATVMLLVQNRRGE